MMNNRYGAWRIGVIPHIPGFPLPVVGLVAPTCLRDGIVSLHIAEEVALHVRAAEIEVQDTTFAEFHQLSSATTVGKAVETALGPCSPENAFDLVAVTSYCVSKGLHAEPDVARATRLILDAYRELARQILAQNRARFN